MAFKELRINDQIRSSEVRLIDDQNNQLGVLSLDAALRIASEKGLDLVEVAPQAQPPVCRLMDYGRFKFETIKKEKDQRRKQNVIKLKEMKLRPKVAEHDFQTKFKGLKQFLEAGEKVKVTIMFRGREMVHQDIGRRILDRVADDAKQFAVIERAPLLEGKNLFMILAPSRQAAPAAAAAAPAPAATETAPKVAAVKAAPPKATATKETATSA
ncbi:MAG TPA: translation initiation factor IF-3 [Candidatus Dormibacteraeota bacterium]|nr:translation initiation factor IF-3 [Candidatus Dormibacteraeota bacterium]